MRTYLLKIRLTLDETRGDPPNLWKWIELLDLHCTETAELLDCVVSSPQDYGASPITDYEPAIGPNGNLYIRCKAEPHLSYSLAAFRQLVAKGQVVANIPGVSPQPNTSK
jgi:hypothetical protein